MGKRIITQTVCDFDGTSTAQTITFGLHSTSYSIDLSAQKLAQLEAFLAPFIAKASVLGLMNTATAVVQTKAGAAKRKAAKKAPKHDPAVVRSWAIEAGLTTATRGRLSHALIGAYERHLRSEAGKERYATSPLKLIAQMESTHTRATIRSFAEGAGLMSEDTHAMGRLPMAVYLAFEEHLAELSAQAEAVIAAAEEVAAAEARRMQIRATGSHKRIYPSDLRPWARSNGMSVGNGAVDTDVLLAYALEKPGALV